MEMIGGIIGGLVLGAIVGFFTVQTFIKRAQQGKIDEMNSKADLVVQEARAVSYTHLTLPTTPYV